MLSSDRGSGVFGSAFSLLHLLVTAGLVSIPEGDKASEQLTGELGVSSELLGGYCVETHYHQLE